MIATTANLSEDDLAELLLYLMGLTEHDRDVVIDVLQQHAEATA